MTTTNTKLSSAEMIKALEKKFTEYICNDFSDIFDSVVESVASGYGIDEEELKEVVTGDFVVSINYTNN